MKNKILFAILFAILVASMMGQSTRADQELVEPMVVTALPNEYLSIPSQDYLTPQVIEEMSSDSLQDFLKESALKYGSDYRELNSTITCESKWNENTVGDNGLAVSVSQFHEGTFKSWAKEMGQPELEWHSAHDQITVMAWAFAQGESYKKHWTTYVAMKNGGVYHFYSQLLQKEFTVYCSMI